jgi:hypothetical protein
LEGGNARILDFVQVLNTLGNVDKQVGASGIGAKAPDLSGVRSVPSVLISHNSTACFEIVTGTDLAVFDSQGEFLIEGLGLEVQTVMFVLGLGEGDNGGLGLDGLTVTNDGVRNL